MGIKAWQMRRRLGVHDFSWVTGIKNIMILIVALVDLKQVVMEREQREGRACGDLF